MPDLLIELFSEEIPARMQARAADDLKKRVTDGLVEAGLTYAGAQGFATPRRLALAVAGLTDRSPALREERRGPRVDAPDKAIDGFARGAGVPRAALETIEDKKGSFYLARIEKPGRPAAEIVAEVLEAAIRNFPWPKSMRWGAGNLRWVRPLHSILCILSDEGGAAVVPLDVDGIVAADVTRGHRFMAPEPFRVTGFDDYAAGLKRARVILDSSERAEQIRQEADNLAFAQGLEVVADPGLLAEVAGLVEWPVPLMGPIDAEFLDLPPEVLRVSMKEHQKFFSLRNPGTGRIEQFITVANIETADQGATILAGNRKVLAARLADAKFFWENDLRVAEGAKLQPWLDGLADVTFHGKLGSQADRVARIAALAREIAPMVGAEPDLAEQAAQVAKADLGSEMVGEFPELQGLMGRYYARAAGLPEPVAAACEDHYAPQGPGDRVPSAPVSVAVALADKLDTLTGFWAIDEKPTGSKDPFALRRAALGVIRLVLENGVQFCLTNYASNWIATQIPLAQRIETLAREIREITRKLNELLEDPIQVDLPINELEQLLDLVSPIADQKNLVAELLVKRRNLKLAHSNWKTETKSKSNDLLSFLHDRLKVHLKGEGIRHDVIDACIAMPGNDDLGLLVRRAEALQAFLATDDGENLIQGFRRANNILTQAEEKDGVEYSFGADVKFAETDEERALFAALDAGQARIAPAMNAQDFGAAMTAMAALRGPIDAFFEAVQVNADNQTVRRNRLNLLSRIRAICLDVADLTRIEG